MLAVAFMAGCGAGQYGAGGVGEAALADFGVPQPPAWTKSRLGVSFYYMVPYSHNPDITVYLTQPPTDPGELLSQITDAQLQPGVQLGVELGRELNQNWQLRFTAGYYHADTTVAWQAPYRNPETGQTVWMSGVYHLDPVVGMPVFLNLQYGAYDRIAPLRWLFGVGAGYVWYGEADPLSPVEGPKDEGLAVLMLGAEVFGLRNTDVRIELGNAWLFENLRHQFMAGLSVAYTF